MPIPSGGTLTDCSTIATSGSDPNVLTSAWLSPSGDALSVVLINAGTHQKVIALRGSGLGSARVTRTVFDGHERMADLGTLPEGTPITLPPRAMATARYDVAF